MSKEPAMLKTILLLKCKDGLSREAFIDYYETRHVPLIRSVMPQIVEYRRNYLNRDGAFITPGASDPDFDVITEIYYANRESYAAAMANAAAPEAAARIAEDSANLFDVSQTRMFVVEERR